MDQPTDEPGLLAPEILFHENKVLVARKPGGLLTQGPPGIDSMELRIKQWRSAQLGPDSKNYLGVPHRLDRPASGVMVFATDKPTANILSRQFEKRQIEKTYWALVEGPVEPAEGTWTDSMRKLPDEAKSEIVAEDHPDSQTAILDYRVLGIVNDVSHLEINLQTGRTHQIRLQSACRGHQILGDELYGSESLFGPQTSDLRLRWIALHARQIKFNHPNTGKTLEFQAEPYSCWQNQL